MITQAINNPAYKMNGMKIIARAFLIFQLVFLLCCSYLAWYYLKDVSLVSLIFAAVYTLAFASITTSVLLNTSNYQITKIKLLLIGALYIVPAIVVMWHFIAYPFID